MTGPEHYKEAERLLATIDPESNPGLTAEGAMAWAAQAQVHATLALAAQQHRIADLLDPEHEGAGATVWAIVEGQAYAGAVRVEVSS